MPSPPAVPAVDVTTVGVGSSAQCCSASVASAGSSGARCSDRIQQSIDQPSCYGVTSPRGSTIGYSGQSGSPTAVQLRWVRLTWENDNARGTKEASAGSNWRTTQ